MPQRLWLLALLFTLIFAVFLGRLFQLQVIRGADYDNRVHQDRLIKDILPARRGRILDRHGTILVDNRAVYHLAIVLRELEIDRKLRRRWPFLRIDEATRDRLAADIAGLLDRPATTVRQILVDELERFPGAALRHRERDNETAVSLLAVERTATGIDEQAMTTAGELQILLPDLRRALTREIQHHRGDPTLVCRPSELAEALSELDRLLDCGPGFTRRLFDAFLHTITVTLPDGATSRWLILTPQRRRLAEDAVARALVLQRDAVSLPLGRVLDRLAAGTVREVEHSRWFYTPGHRGQDLADLLPGTITIDHLAVAGAPGGREQIWYLQGDPADADDGLFSLFCRRLHASLGSRGDWLPALLLQEAAQETALRIARRYHPQHIAILDHRHLATFCDNLAARLQRQGRDEDALDIEVLITRSRRRADRAWAGSTSSDPIPFLRAIDKHLAIALAPDAARIPEDIASRYHTRDTPLPGLRVVSDLGREYRFEGSAVHIIGRMGRLSAAYDRDEARIQGLDPEGWKGASGLELAYDRLLHGVTGRRIRLLSAEGTREHIDPPAAGQDLRTTLDIDLQRQAEHALQNWLPLTEDLGRRLGVTIATERMRRSPTVGRGRAGMILMDPWTGEILAMASTPSYLHADLRTNYQRLAEDPAQPLIDHSVTASHPPGSTIKPLVAMAAFAEGFYQPGEVIHSSGHLGTMGDTAPAGNYDLVRALRRSSNVFFAALALRMGPERLVDWYFRLGCGRMTSPDIPWQRLQFATHTPQTITETRPQEPFWTIGDTRRLGIGNFWAASPLEIVPIAACLATQGRVVTPHLVPGFDERGHDKREPRDRISLTERQWAAIHRGMVAAASPTGTAPYLRLDTSHGPITVAAKSGTSEWGSQESRRRGLTPGHAWLLGYAPAEKPVIAFAIFIHSGTSGGRASTAAVRFVLESYFNRYGPTGHRQE